MERHRAPEPGQDESGSSSNRFGPAAIAPSRMVGNWRLRQKLAAVLVLPVLATLVFAGLAIRSEISDVHQLGSVLDELALGRQAANVDEMLQRERDAAMVVAASGKVDGNAEYRQAAAETDTQTTSLRTLASHDTDINPGVAEAISASLEALDGVGELRSSVQDTGYPATAALGEYDRIIAGTVAVNRAVAADATSAGTTPQAASLYLVALEDQAQQEATLVIMAEQPANVTPALSTALNSATIAYSSDFATFASVATPDQRQQVQDTVSGPDVDNRARYVQIALAESAADKPLTVAAATIQPVATTTVDLGWQVEQSLLDQVQNTLQGRKASTLTGLTTNIATVAAIVLVVLAIMLAMSAAMVRPLRLLRGSALEVARATLPDAVERILASEDPIEASADAIDPIPPYTREEVGDVARSFDVVHGQAVRLAAEQAVLRDNVNAIFVNLARRSQVLVERQLSLIDRLERDEQDPDQLANLFELDHLATRMRRNSESLLVLSGSGLAKRISQSVPIGELVGAAVSEVEQYARIDVGSPPDVQIFGRVVNDLVHLIAELLDNATVFSQPNTKVSVRIAKTRSREVAIQITDRGVGMSEEKIRASNERLLAPPQLDADVTKRMGLYVVARLAKRHHIRVKLHTNEDIEGGIVALVAIPEDLVHPVAAPMPEYRAARSQWFRPGKPTEPAPTRDRNWRGPADDGWRRAEHLRTPAAYVTDVGLPKRLPSTHLLPGAPADPPMPGAPAAPPPRSAEQIRSRLSRYQRGAREGRSDDSPPDHPNAAWRQP